MSTENSMTAFASSGKRDPVNGRPPVMAWTLRMLLCVTDSRTQDGDTARMWGRANEELTEEERGAVFDAVLGCLKTIREAATSALPLDTVPIFPAPSQPYDQDAAAT